MAKEIQLIIFDCDGTLVNSEPITLRIMAGLFEELGIQISYEECHEKFVGSHFSRIIEFIQSHDIEVNPREFEDHYRYLCSIAFAQELEPIDGVVPFLQRLNIPFCIASNGPKHKMNITLTATGLDNYFATDTIFSAYDIQKWKPDPGLFLYAAESMGINPDNCLVVEDTIHGINAALSADMEVVGINVQSQKEKIISHGVPVFDNMHDVSSHILHKLESSVTAT